MKYSSDDLMKIARYEEKRGIKYKKANGKLAKWLLFFGFVSWLWMTFTSLAFILGKLISINSGNDKADDIYVTIIVATAVSFLALFLYIFRLRVSAYVVSIVSAVLTFISFAKLCDVDESISSAGSQITEFDQGLFGLKKIFYWRHGIPVLLLVILFLILIFIIVRERRIIKKEYDLISKNNYEPQIVSDDE